MEIYGFDLNRGEMVRRIHAMEYYVGTSEERKEDIPGLQPGYEFYETDTHRRFWYTGSKWLEKALEGRGVEASLPSLADVPIGFVFWALDTGDIFVSTGSEWKKVGEV